MQMFKYKGGDIGVSIGADGKVALCITVLPDQHDRADLDEEFEIEGGEHGPHVQLELPLNRMRAFVACLAEAIEMEARNRHAA